MRKSVLLNASFAPSLILFRGPLIAELIRRGYDVHASAPDFDPATATAVRALGATVHDVPLKRRGTGIRADLSYCAALRRVIVPLRPVLVIGYTAKPNIWGSIAAALAGSASASMVTGTGFVLASGGRVAIRVARAASRLLYRIATAINRTVVFQNPDDLTDFIRAGCLASDRKALIVNGSGVDEQHYAPVPLPDGARFLMIARLLTSKGVREYVDAARSLREVLPDASFAIAGPLDPGHDAIDADEVAGWQSAGIDYLGELSDVRGALGDASIYVLPSYREGTPRSVLEAMAMGRPVITTDVPGCRETVVDGRNGLLVPSRCVEPLAAAMLRLATDGATRSKMGEEGRKMILARYTVASVNADLLAGLGLPLIETGTHPASAGDENRQKKCCDL